jgi:hypothetical protein
MRPRMPRSVRHGAGESQGRLRGAVGGIVDGGGLLDARGGGRFDFGGPGAGGATGRIRGAMGGGTRATGSLVLIAGAEGAPGSSIWFFFL